MDAIVMLKCASVALDENNELSRKQRVQLLDDLFAQLHAGETEVDVQVQSVFEILQICAANM